LITDPFNPSELTLSKKIDLDGTVLLPELGALPVAGYSSSELEKLLTEKWSPYFEKLDVHVVINYLDGGGRYFIYGEVGTQGEQCLKTDTTIFEAVMAARADESKADLVHVRVFSGDSREGFEVNVLRMLKTGDSSRNVLVRECDIIFVPPTLRARLVASLERFRSWIREWILNPPILIAGSPSR
jgi:protein involved in polysaccharide export with SLBB domain